MISCRRLSSVVEVLVDVELLFPVGETPAGAAACVTGLLFIAKLELVLVICAGTTKQEQSNKKIKTWSVQISIQKASASGGKNQAFTAHIKCRVYEIRLDSCLYQVDKHHRIVRQALLMTVGQFAASGVQIFRIACQNRINTFQ